MIGKVDSLDYDGDAVRRVRLTFPQRERDGSSDSSMTMDIHMCECIGKGSFGTVYRAVSADYPQLAVKISTGKTTRLRQELDVLRKVCTKGALPLPRFEFGALNQTSDLIVIGMELCMPCTLHDLLLSTRLTSTRDMLFIAHQAAQAVGCVHAEGCIHRDVKLQNYVFDSQGNLKLIDFGLSCNTLKPPAGDVVAGTVSFMSPEMAHNALHKEQRVSVGASADVWSLGIVLFSIFTQRNPYPTTPAVEANEGSRGEQGASTGHGTSVDTTSEGTAIPQKRINEALLRRVSRGEWQWPVGCTVPSELKQLVEAVLVVNPEQRPTVEAILAMRVWNNRARAPPSAVTAFLGVQDDFFFSNDEETLLKAVEQRSEGVKASRTQSRAGSRDVSVSRRALRAANEEDEDVHDPQKRDSLKFVAKESAMMGGTPSVQVYDVRASTKKRSKPIREISQVIAEETAKAATKAGGRRARSAKSKSAVAPTSAATAPSSRIPSRRSSAPASRAGSRGPVADARTDEVTDAATPKHSSPSNAYEVNSTPSTTGHSSGDISAANDGQRRTATSRVEDKGVCTRLEDEFEMGTREEPRRPHGGRLSRSEPALPTGGSLHIVSTTVVNDEEDRDERHNSDLEDEEGSTAKAAPKSHGNSGASRSRPRDTTLRERSSSILNGVSHPGSRETSVNMNRLPSHLSSRQASRQAAPAPPLPPAPPAAVPTDPFLADSNSNSTSNKRSHKAKKATAKKRPRSIPRNASSTDELIKPLTPSKKLALELTMEVFMRQEHDCRALLARRLMLEQQWLLTAFRVMTEEHQERAHIVWNGTEQLANLEHPHTFKELLEIPNKTYANGFTCDACLYDFFPDGRTKKSMHFFHCTCGQDLCPDCYRDYTRRCTCACCGVVHRNPKALREHTKSGVAACRPRAAAGIVSAASAGVVMDEPLSYGAPPSLGSTSRLAANRANFTSSKKGGSGKTVSPAQHLKRSGKSSSKSTAAVTAHMGIAQGTLRERLDAASEIASYSDSAPFQGEDEEEADFSDGSDDDDGGPRGRHRRRGARVAPRNRSARQRPPPVPEHFEKEIAELPKGPWKPFAKLRSDRNEIDPSRMPTAQERQDILNGEWLRYFYFYPPVETEETFAFVYHAQPGRTGAVFLNSEFTAHSAVFSMLEHQFFVVENIQMECRAEEDVTVAMPLAMAKSNPRVKGTYQALEAIVAHDTNMTKQQRPPGTMSVYFPPTNMFTSKGAPVLYVRWFRCSADRTITAILLSNGALQVFVNNEFELRWLDPERKFLIGKNGTCELIDDETFELAPLINDVLYSSYDV